MIRFLTRVLCAALFLAWPSVLLAEDVEVRSSPIRSFKIGSDETRFGPLEFVGGLEMGGRSRNFGAISGFRFRDAGETFVAVTDTGFWITGKVERDAEGRPSGWSLVRMEEMRGPDGAILTDKYSADAEGIALDGDTVVVSYERRHRLSEFEPGEGGMGAPVRDLDFLVPSYELRRNRGFETLAIAPMDSPLGGARIAVTEKSLDKAGNIFGAVLTGPRKGIFTVKRIGAFDITDGAFLPDGDLVITERSYSVGVGVALRLRRIDGAAIRAGAVLDGDVLFTADMSYQIDNMEGMDIWRAADGDLRLSLVSDDNKSILQRNLYLEFRFAD